MVPLYDTLGEQGVKYILNQTELRILLAHPATLPNYIKYLPDTPFVKMLVKLPDSAGQDTCSEEEVNAARENEVEIVSWTEFLGSGQLHMCEPNFPTPDDVCTLCYTSGMWLQNGKGDTFFSGRHSHILFIESNKLLERRY